MSDPVPVPRSELRQLSSRVVGIVLGVLIVAGALGWAVWKVDSAVDDVHAEVDRSAAERCRVTLVRQDRSLTKDIRIFTRLGHELGASQARIDEFVDGIRADYEALPIPADCEGGG